MTGASISTIRWRRRDRGGRAPAGPVGGHGPQATGVAAVLAVILLAVFGALAAALATETHLNLRKSDNDLRARAARLQAESGVIFYAYQLRQIRVPPDTPPAEMLEAVAAELQARLNGTDNLGQQIVEYDGSAITIPLIVTNARGGGFAAVLDLSDLGNLRLTVTGHDLARVRRIRLCFAADGGSGSLDYGIMTNGWVDMTGNAHLEAANDRQEAAVLAASGTHPEAVKLTGNCVIDGDVSTCDVDSYVSCSGNVSVGGAAAGSGAFQDHIHVGIGPVLLPTPDPGVFEGFAGNTVDGSTNTDGNRTFTNIRIRANTNPTFSGNIRIDGVVFIESPNRVTFSGNLELTGVIVTEDAGKGALDDNHIHFSGNTSVRGVEYLSGPEHEALRGLPGSFLIAPGFSTKFTGNFGTVNGTLGADEFQFAGNAGGTIHGALINWGDTELKLVGNSHLRFDQSHYGGLPPGFLYVRGLAAIPGSYEEL